MVMSYVRIQKIQNRCLLTNNFLFQNTKMWSRKLRKCALQKTVNTASPLPQWGFLMSSRSLQGNDVSKQTNTSGVVTTQSSSTVDVADVEFFSKQMNYWWIPDGKMALLHRMNLISISKYLDMHCDGWFEVAHEKSTWKDMGEAFAQQVPFIRDGLLTTANKLAFPLKGKKILDVGCGGGILSEGLARLGASVTGIDPSKDLIRVAEEHKKIDPKIQTFRPTYYHCTIEEHSKTAPNLYDGVVASEVIEHVQNQELFVKSCIKACKPRGKIFFTTPNRTKFAQFALIFLAENILKSIPQGAHQFEKFITPNELTFILERNNCHVDLTYGLTYSPFTGKWNFSEFTNLMYAMQASKLP